MLVNGVILFLTIQVVNLSKANLQINMRTLDVNTRNAGNSGRMVEELTEINNKTKGD